MGEELWYVKVADDDVHRMTLDQLDGAFQAGHIDESTMVLAADATKWARLGELLGLDDATEEAPDPPPHAVATAPMSRAYAAPVSYAVAPPVAVTRAATAPMAAVAMARPASIAPAPAFVPNTLRPMSLDLEDGEFDAPFRQKSRKGWVVAVIGIAAVAGGVGFAATRARASSNDIAAAAAAAAKTVPPPAPNPEPVAAPAPPPPSPAMATNPAAPAANAGAAAASPMSPHFTDRFNEDPKLKVIAAEKEHEQKAKGRHSGGGGAASHSATKSKSTTFTTGGNKFDPLNSSI